MKQNNNKFVKFLKFSFYAYFILLTIIFVYVFAPILFPSEIINDFINNFTIPSFEEIFSSSTTWIIIILSIAFVSLFHYQEKKQNEKIENIKKDFPEIKGQVVDILIHMHMAGKHSYYDVYPIIQSFDNDKFYVFFKNYGIKKWNYSYSYSIFSPFKYKLYHNGKNINIGDTVKFYITKEIDTFKINGEMLEFENIKYKYLGMNSENENFFNFLSRDILLNETRNDFLNMINDMIIFDGFIDFNYDDNYSSL